MKVSLAWLKEFVDIAMPVERFAHALTLADTLCDRHAHGPQPSQERVAPRPGPGSECSARYAIPV